MNWRDLDRYKHNSILCIALFVMSMCSCATETVGNVEKLPGWRNTVQVTASDYDMPQPIDTALAVFICLAAWTEIVPANHATLIDVLGDLTIGFVEEQILLDEMPLEYTHICGVTDSPTEVRVSYDSGTNPLVSFGHECGHVGSFAILGSFDHGHADEGVWGMDGGFDGPGIVGRVKTMIRDLHLGTNNVH